MMHDGLHDITGELAAILEEIHHITAADGPGGRRVTPGEVVRLLALLSRAVAHLAPLVVGR